MEKKKIEVKVGDLINVNIAQGHKGSFPIGKYGSIFCKLYIPKAVGKIEYDSTCLCKVTSVTEKILYVTIMEVVRSASYNRFELQKHLQEVKVEDQTGKAKKKNLSLGEAFVKAANKNKK